MPLLKLPPIWKTFSCQSIHRDQSAETVLWKENVLELMPPNTLSVLDQALHGAKYCTLVNWDLAPKVGPVRKNCSAHNHAVQAITSVKFWPNLEAKTWKIWQNTISWCSRKSLFFKIVFIGEYKLWQQSDIVAEEETWCKDDQRSENNQAGMEEPSDCAKE